MRDFPSGYCKNIWRYYERDGGYGHIGAYLTELDLSGFDPKEPPPKTAAFWDTVNINAAPEDTELADVIEAMGKLDPATGETVKPAVLTMTELVAKAKGSTLDWLMERKNFRALKHRLGRCGYVSVKNPQARRRALADQ
jgi:hypothetical protein